MTDDEQGLQRAEQLEAELERELTARANRHRAWLVTQLAPLEAEAQRVERDLDEEVARRHLRHQELKDSNPEEYQDGRGRTWKRSHDAWAAVALFFGLTVFMLFGTAEKFDPGWKPLIAAGDAILFLFGFLALTPLWSPAPKPPARLPRRPTLPNIDEPRALPSGTWRTRLENAQAMLAKITKGEQGPDSSTSAQQALAQARADLQRFIADGRVYLANTETDYFGWVGEPWPPFVRLIRLLGLAAVPGALVPLTVTFGEMGLVHGSIALAGGLAAGFFRRSNLSFVEPPEVE